MNPQDDLLAVLTAQMALRPQMQPQDAVKLLYQQQFGGGHIISDPQTSLRYLTQEMSGLEADAGEPLWEDIGGGMGRLNLRAAKARGWPLSLINRLFVAGANGMHGPADRFSEVLEDLRRLTNEGRMPFSADVLDKYLDGYCQAGCPAVHHSEAYRQAYHPAYRVIPGRYIRSVRLLGAIDRLLENKSPAAVALDGPCGSGKTTLAGLIAEVFDAAVIPMDDFFLPGPLRTDERLAQPGGNIDWERFLAEVTPYLRGGVSFAYRAFDCTRMDYADAPREVPPRPLTVVEGSYSLHPRLAHAYDLKVFIDCTSAGQRRRILKRSGPKMLARFIGEWIPMENRYFDSFAIRGGCDLVVDGEGEDCDL